MSEAAPLWICFTPQLASVLGDSIGQRCSRVYHNGNRRRFIIALISVSSLQMFVVLAIIQLSLPNTTTIIYETVNGTTVDWCAQPEQQGSPRCYPQGPLTIYRMLGMCPLLLLNGLLNIIYYVGEASMYREPLGVLMLVLAALASSFIIAPMQEWFDLDGAKQVSGGAVALGILGAVACLIERTPPSWAASDLSIPTPQMEDDENAEEEKRRCTSLSSSSLHIIERTPLTIQAGNSSISPQAAVPKITHRQNGLLSGHGAQKLKAWLHRVKALLPLFGPFVLLSFAYALYFVIMLVYNDKCRVNMWGYNAYDQVTFPVYMLLVFFIVDFISPCRRNFPWDERQGEERLLDACRTTFRELFGNRGAGFWHMFLYRLLINTRAVAYTYITVQFNLSSSYLELTLIRVVLSWVASLLLVLLLPSFIHSEALEQAKLKDPINLTLKVIGTCAIVGSLVIIHYD